MIAGGGRDPNGTGTTGQGAGARVLVVEDDFRTAVFLQRALTQAGYRVELVEDGVAALAAPEAVQPDVVVLDVMLPGLDGLEVARRLRAVGGVPT